MKNIHAILMALLMGLFLSAEAKAMEPAQIKQILNITKKNWISFRDFNGRQLIYFTHLEAYTCGIKEVRYSINSEALDKRWTLQPCNPQKQGVVEKERIWLSFPLNSVKYAVVQLVFADGSESEAVRFSPLK